MIERFKKMRKELGLTLDDVAKALGITIGSVAGWEQRGKIPGDRIYQIERKFGVSSDWLRAGEGEMLQVDKKQSISDFSDEELEIELVRRMFERLPERGKRLVLEYATELAKKEGSIVESKSQTNSGTIGGDMIQN